MLFDHSPLHLKTLGSRGLLFVLSVLKNSKIGG